MFGITQTGFNRKRLPEIKADLEAALRAEFGDITTGPDSVFGQIIGVFSKSSADLWEALEAVYNAMYPSTATGISLDQSVELVGVRRLDASKTEVTLWLVGADGATVPQGSQARVPETGAIFATVAATPISRSTALRATLSFVSTGAGTYRVRINQDLVELVYTTGDLPALLVDEINNLPHPVTASVDDDDNILLVADDQETFFVVEASTQMQVTDIAVAALALCTVTGPTLALAGTVDEIVTPVTGWDSVENPRDGIVGRAVENDVQLRARRRNSLRVIGAASLEAIRARLLQEVDNVQTVVIYENRLPTPDEDGRPGHSFETVIQGGDDDDIAVRLWNLKPAGIQTFGNTTRVITDSQGDPQGISFSRPVQVPIEIDADIQIDLDRFPALGALMIRDALVAFGNSLAVGEDVAVQRFFCTVFQFPGVLAIRMTVTRIGEPGTETDGVLGIGRVEIATFDANDCSVNPTTSPL